MTMKGKMILLAVLITMLALSGCGLNTNGVPEIEAPEEPASQEVPADESDQAEMPAPLDEQNTEELPETLETIILIEGMEEAMTLKLFQHKELPFYTYYPEDMLYEEWVYDNEKGVRFFANFGGTINKNAYVEIKLFSQADMGSESDFIAFVGGESGILENRGVEWVEKEADIDRVHSWTIIEYYYLNDEIVGSLHLGEHQDDYFYIDVHYPWEYGDGMEARVNHIMQGFHWNQGEKLLQLSN